MPELILANPITCEPGLTGDVPNMVLVCVAKVVDGVVTELRVNEYQEIHVIKVGEAQFSYSSRRVDEHRNERRAALDRLAEETQAMGIGDYCDERRGF